MFAVWRSCHSWNTVLCMCRANLTTQGSCTLGLAPCWLVVMQPVKLASLPKRQECSQAIWLWHHSILLTGSKSLHLTFCQYECCHCSLYYTNYSFCGNSTTQLLCNHPYLWMFPQNYNFSFHFLWNCMLIFPLLAECFTAFSYLIFSQHYTLWLPCGFQYDDPCESRMGPRKSQEPQHTEGRSGWGRSWN